jgi:hypothetical protein
MAARPGPGPRGTMSASPPRTRGSPVLLIVLVVALAVGAAASLVAGAATSPAFHAGRYSEIALSEGTLAAIVVLIAFVALGLFLYVRFTSNTLGVPKRWVVTALTIIVILILLTALFHVLGNSTAPNSSTSTGTTANNTTGTGTTTNSTGNLSGPGGQLDVLSVHLPGWSLFVAVALVAIIGAAIAVPALRAASLRRDRIRTASRAQSAEVAQVRGALAVAVQELDEGQEPRAVVIRLYTTLLRRVGTMVGGIEEVTPEEIRSLHLERLGIRSTAATSLTRLFEEARYSSHPMGPEAADRATVAISHALEDLDRSTSADP